MRFEPSHIEMLTGGAFDLGKPETVADLRAALQEMDKELQGWGDERKISEMFLDRKKQVIRILLAEGIPQP